MAWVIIGVSASYVGGGGGGGGYTKNQKISVTQGDNISISIGSIGGSSSVGNVNTSPGGSGVGMDHCIGGNGGSGGGGGGYQSFNGEITYGGRGGKDGGNGGTGLFDGGSGQGTTTRAFGESEGTLYASGGSGGTYGDGGGTGNPETGGKGIAIIRWGY